MKWLYPRMSWRTLRYSLGIGAIGSLVAGCYGIVHDQITYTLSPEYFTRFKFHQFAHANFGWGDRAFAGTIGFLATWWVGLIGGWLLGRTSARKDGTLPAMKELAPSFCLVMAASALVAFFGFLYGTVRWAQSPDAWSWWRENYGVEDLSAFARVGHIHNGSYVGGAIGTIIVVARTRRRNRTATA
ncbi:MAG: hypothetical protein AAGJ79_03045 [Verrucomicrobiota bacterium]